MDTLTHSLAGALIGQAGLKRKTGLAMPARPFPPSVRPEEGLKPNG